MNERAPFVPDRGVDIETFRLALVQERRVFIAFLAAVMIATGVGTALTERGGQPAVSVTGEAAHRGTTPYCVR